MPLHSPQPNLREQLFRKGVGRRKVLGAEDARCVQDPRPSDFDPKRLAKMYALRLA